MRVISVDKLSRVTSFADRTSKVVERVDFTNFTSYKLYYTAKLLSKRSQRCIYLLFKCKQFVCLFFPFCPYIARMDAFLFKSWRGDIPIYFHFKLVYINIFPQMTKCIRFLSIFSIQNPPNLNLPVIHSIY